MIFESLHESAERGELMLVENGFCNFHLRRDGQLTIREIISTKKGAGAKMLERLKRIPGATSLFAKCPVNLPSNLWYTRRGFHVERMEITPSGRKLHHWRMNLPRKAQPNVAGGIELIYCAGNNKTFAELAIDAGLHVGARLPSTVYYQPYFADNEFNNPKREKYMQGLAQYKPYIASVLDWDERRTYDEVMSWADEASQHAQVIMVIPKIIGTVHQIPETINGKPIRLGYSVPTEHGKTDVPLSEFGNRPVHLLGGAPSEQIRISRILNVKSADGNYIQKNAVERCQYWTPHTIKGAVGKHSPTLREVGIYQETEPNAMAIGIAFKNWFKAWNERNIIREVFPPEQMRLEMTI